MKEQKSLTKWVRKSFMLEEFKIRNLGVLLRWSLGSGCPNLKMEDLNQLYV